MNNVNGLKIFNKAIQNVKHTFDVKTIVSISKVKECEHTRERVAMKDRSIEFTSMQYVDIKYIDSSNKLVKKRIVAGNDGVIMYNNYYKSTGVASNVKFKGECYKINALPLLKYEQLGYDLTRFNELEYDERLSLLDSIKCPHGHNCYDDPYTIISCYTCKSNWLNERGDKK